MSQMYKNLKVRNEAILWARDLIQRSDWLIMDAETTGLKQSGRNLASYDEIIQIGIIDPHGNTVFESLVNPIKRRMAQDARDIHGINFRMLKDAPRFSEILPKLHNVLNGKLVIAYNAEFERQMLIQTAAKFRQEEINTYDFKCIMQCAMVQYSNFIGEWSDYYNDYKWQKLPGSTHNVIGDCLAVLNLIKEIASAELSPIPDQTAITELTPPPTSWLKNLLNFFQRKK